MTPTDLSSRLAALATLCLAFSLGAQAPAHDNEVAELRRALRRSEGTRLCAQALLAIDEDPGLAVALATEGLTRHRSATNAGALQSALDALHEQRTLLGHTGPVRSATFTDDGQVLTAAEDGAAILWDPTRGVEVARFASASGRLREARAGGASRVLTRSFDPWLGTELWNVADGARIATLVGASDAAWRHDGHVLASPGVGGTVTWWNATDGSELHHADLGRPVSMVRFSPRGQVLAALDDGTVQLLDRGRAIASHVLAGHTRRVRCAAFNTDGAIAVTGGEDGTAIVWNLAEGDLELVLEPHEQGVVAVALSPTADLVLTLAGIDAPDAERSVRVWERESGTLLYQLEGSWLTACFSPGADELATAGSDGTIALWHAETGTRRASLRGHRGPVLDLTYHPAGELLVSAGHDGTARVWHRRSGAERRMLGGHRAALTDASFSPDGSTIATASTDHTAQLHRVGATITTPYATLAQHEHVLTGIAFAPDGHQVVTSALDNTAVLWSLGEETDGTPRLVRVLDEHGHMVGKTAFSPDGTVLATACHDGAARLFRAADGALLRELWHGEQNEPAGVTDLVFSRDGDLLLTSALDFSARLWRVASGELHAKLDGHVQKITGLAFVEGEAAQLAVTGSADRTARVFDRDGQLVATLADHGQGAISHLRAGPDGTVLAAARDGSLRQWHAETGALVRQLAAAGSTITGLAVSTPLPPGTALAAACTEAGTATLWNLTTGQLARELPPARTPAGSVAALNGIVFDPAGTRVLTRRPDGVATMWPVDPLTAAARKAPRKLSPTERTRFDLEPR